MILPFWMLETGRRQHFPVSAGVENASVGGKQTLMQRAMWWKLYSNVIDLFILDGSRQQFNIITFPDGRVVRFRMHGNQSYFTPPNDTIMSVWFIPTFTLGLVDEFTQSLIHSITPIQLVHLPTRHRLMHVKQKRARRIPSPASPLIRAW